MRKALTVATRLPGAAAEARKLLELTGMVRVKICGLRREQDAVAAVEAGADALGFNFWKQTPRYIAPAEAARIIRNLPPEVLTVGVFVDEAPETVLEIAAQTGIGALQLHGSETPEYLERLNGYRKIKALKVAPDFQPEHLKRYRSAELFLLDGFIAGMQGGTGQPFDWSLAEKAGAYGRIIVAGGLRASNVADAVRCARPWGVDVASGVETEPGKKDPLLIRQFIQAARSAESQLKDRPAHGQDSTDRGYPGKMLG